MRANKSVRPTQFLKVFDAGLIVRKELLELWKRARKREVVVLKDIHLHRLKSYHLLVGVSTG
jgi:hypothetical protein